MTGGGSRRPSRSAGPGRAARCRRRAWRRRGRRRRRHGTAGRARAPTRHLRPWWPPACLATLVSASDTTKNATASMVGEVRRPCRRGAVPGRGPRGDAGERRVEALVVEHGRVQAADEVAQLLERLLGLLVRLLDRLAGRLGQVGEGGAGHARGSWPARPAAAGRRRAGPARCGGVRRRRRRPPRPGSRSASRSAGPARCGWGRAACAPPTGRARPSPAPGAAPAAAGRPRRRRRQRPRSGSEVDREHQRRVRLQLWLHERRQPHRGPAPRHPDRTAPASPPAARAGGSRSAATSRSRASSSVRAPGGCARRERPRTVSAARA